MLQKLMMKHVWGKLCSFIHYNVLYVMFIVTYITLKLQIDIKVWHISHKCYGWNHKIYFKHVSWATTFCVKKPHYLIMIHFLINLMACVNWTSTNMSSVFRNYKMLCSIMAQPLFENNANLPNTIIDNGVGIIQFNNTLNLDDSHKIVIH